MIIRDQFDPDLRKMIKKKKQIAIIPVGSIEQHGPHLPISTDSDIVTEIASRLSKKINGVLLPTINYGISNEHFPFFNLSIKKSTLSRILEDLCESLIKNGIWGDPTKSSAKLGKKIIKEIVDNLVKESNLTY